MGFATHKKRAEPGRLAPFGRIAVSARKISHAAQPRGRYRTGAFKQPPAARARDVTITSLPRAKKATSSEDN
jgi:hypothetical protein